MVFELKPVRPGGQMASGSGLQGMDMPALIGRSASPGAIQVYAEWLLGGIRNRGTRGAYAAALRHFDEWLSSRAALSIEQLQPLHIAAYLEHLESAGLSVSTRKLRRAAISELCKHLVVHQVIPTNPAAVVKGPREVRKKGATPVLSGEQARALIDACTGEDLHALRDKALTATMLFTFARVSAATRLRVKDYQSRGRRAVLMLREKGNQVIEAPCHHELAEHLDTWLQASGLARQPEHILFPPIVAGQMRNTPLDSQTTLIQLQRRALRAGIETKVTNHSLRATGITAYLKNGGTLEIAQQLAGHASPVTTKVYDRRTDEVSAAEVERIRFE